MTKSAESILMISKPLTTSVSCLSLMSELVLFVQLAYQTLFAFLQVPPLKKSKITASKPSPRNDEQKKSRMRLSWANEIAVDIDSAPNEIGVSDSDSLSDVEDYVDDEERQIKEKMKGGKPEALVNTVLQVFEDEESYTAVVLAIVDAANFSYLVERNANSDSKRWESGGAQSTVEINPCDGKWSFIGRKSSRGRIVMKSSSYDPGPVIATGRRRTKPKLAKRRKEKIFLSSASMRSDKYAPSVIQQDRMTFTRTPKKKRRNDAKNGLKYMCEKLGDAVLPNQTPNTKKNIMLEAISGRKNDDDGKFGPFRNCLIFLVGDFLTLLRPDR